MSTFLIDLLHDLRAKRLLPVAAALLVAIVAVPVVLAKSSSGNGGDGGVPSSAAPSPSSAAASAQKQIAALVEGGGGRRASDLGKYGSKNPFRPAAGFARKPAQLGSATGSATASGSSGAGGSAGKGSAGGSGSGSGTAGSPPAVTAPVPGVAPPVKVRQRAYSYVADLTFTANGRTRRIRGTRRLRMLPSPSSPLLLFLGVTQSGGDAVFLVDSSLRAAGEGRCSPSPSQCATVAIGPGAEHDFTNAAGDSYTLRVDEIRKVALRSRSKASAARRAAASRRRARAAGAGTIRRFSLPVLVDLVSGPDPAGARSSARRGGR